MKSLGDKECKGHSIPAEIWVYFNVASNFNEKVGSVSAMSHSGCMHSRYPQSQTGVMLLQFISFPRDQELFVCLHLFFVMQFDKHLVM